MIPKQQQQTEELLAFLLWPVIASVLSFAFLFSPFISIFVFYGVPCFYLCIRKPRQAPKAGVFALVIGVPLMFVVDYVAHLTKVWYVYNTLPRILTYVTIEDIVWTVGWIFFTVMFYEHFLHHRVSEKIWNPHLKYIISGIIIFLTAFALCLINFSSLLNIPYFYLIVGLTLILVPVIIEAFNYPRILLTFFGTAAYFFYFNIIYELVALKLRWWTFPGTQFIGQVTLLGLTFPFEEFFFWIILGGFAVLSYFRIFDTSQKT